MDTYSFDGPLGAFVVTRLASDHRQREGAFFSSGRHQYDHVSAAGLELLRLAEENARLKEEEAAFAPDRLLEAVRRGERERIQQLALDMIGDPATGETVYEMLPRAAVATSVLPVPDDRPTTLRRGAMQGWETALRELVRRLDHEESTSPSTTSSSTETGT